MSAIPLQEFAATRSRRGELRGGYELLIEGDRIKKSQPGPIKAAKRRCGRLRQAHADAGPDRLPRAHASQRGLHHRMEAVPLTLMTARAAAACAHARSRLHHRARHRRRRLGHQDRGRAGPIPGPRLFIAGRSIGPTGGHYDRRRRTDVGRRCPCCNGLAFIGCIADGVDEVRKAAREQMRQGADHVKIMVSGGVASPYDPLDIAAVLRGRDHAPPSRRRTLSAATCCATPTRPKPSPAPCNCGVRTIEHGNLIDDAAAKLMAAEGRLSWSPTSSPTTP